jgi:phosphoribosylformimino-5-aminoimidazole carboxamide ribotide isomerase
VASFELLPAIDLRAGRVVRLSQGDFDRETAYDTDPPAVARRFADSGATWIHVVDLEGAVAGEPVQLQLASEIVAEVYGRARVEVGGGLRTPASVAGALGTGAARAVIGTKALQDPGFALGLVTRYGRNRIVASIDVRDGMALGDGWREGSPGVPVADAVGALASAGVEVFEVTAIDRDGLLGGPDIDLLRSLVAMGHGRVIASGGISSIADVIAVQAAGCAGAIVGRAIYEGRVDLRELARAVAGLDVG